MALILFSLYRDGEKILEKMTKKHADKTKVFKNQKRKRLKFLGGKKIKNKKKLQGILHVFRVQKFGTECVHYFLIERMKLFEDKLANPDLN